MTRAHGTYGSYGYPIDTYQFQWFWEASERGTRATLFFRRISTVWPTAIKFGTATQGEARVSKGSCSPCHKGRAPARPIFGVPHTYATAFDAWRPNSAWEHLGEGRVFWGIFLSIAYFTNASRGLSAIAEFLVNVQCGTLLQWAWTPSRYI